MSEVALISLGATALVILALIVLSVFLYPFLFRFWVDSKEPTLGSTALVNGSNGNNGLPGKDSKMTANGTPGAPGANSPPGLTGQNGRQGGQGLGGIKGNDGEVGVSGVDGSQGVPGLNLIPVKQDIFSSTERVYYVNGVPLTDHISGLSDKATTLFNKEKARVGSRLETSFKSEANRTHFRQVFEKLMENPTVTPLPIPDMKLDTVEKWNYFLDLVLTEYTTQRAALKNVKDTQLPIISTAKETLAMYRADRISDKAQVDANTYQLSLRVALITPVQTPLPTGGDYYTQLQLLKTDINKTFDSSIRDLNNLLSSQKLIYSTTTNTPAVRNAAAAKIDELHIAINGIRALKAAVKAHNDNKKQEIDEKSRTGGMPTNEHGATFSTYGPALAGGTNAEKSIITTACNAITAAEAACQSALNGLIGPWKTANPI